MSVHASMDQRIPKTPIDVVRDRKEGPHNERSPHNDSKASNAQERVHGSIGNYVR